MQKEAKKYLLKQYAPKRHSRRFPFDMKATHETIRSQIMQIKNLKIKSRIYYGTMWPLNSLLSFSRILGQYRYTPVRTSRGRGYLHLPTARRHP